MKKARVEKSIKDPKRDAKSMKTTMKALPPANLLAMKGGNAKNVKPRK
jgi:hypothetical protein